MFCGDCYYDLEAVCREYWTCGTDAFFSWFVSLSDETSLSLSGIPRGLCSLHWQPVRLQHTWPWCCYSGGPTSGVHPTGKMQTYTRKTPIMYPLITWEHVSAYGRFPHDSIWPCGFTHLQRSVLQAVSQAAKRIQSGHINNLQSVHIRQEVNRRTKKSPLSWKRLTINTSS